jgi:hypothetical protein
VALLGVDRHQRAFSEALTRDALHTRHDQGATITSRPAVDRVPAGHDLLFVVQRDGQLTAVTEHTRPTPSPGDTLILLTPARVASGTAAPSRTNTPEEPER